MIVISGALVLVALVLLVVGLTMEDLPFVYGSIGTSLLAFVFLVIGILQRRGEQAGDPAAESAPAAAPAPVPSLEETQPVPVPVGTSPVDVSKRPTPVADRVQLAPEPEMEGGEPDEQLLGSGVLVLVVAGRPRYHADGCRYLNGKDVEEIDVLDARDEGFTPCGVCRPDEVVAAELEADRLEDDNLQRRPAAEADDLAPSDRRDGVLVDDQSLLGDQPDVEPDPEPVAAPAAPARRGSRVVQPVGDRTVVPATSAAPAPSAAPPPSASAAAEAVAVGVVALAAAGVAASAGIRASRAAKAAKAPAKPAKAPVKRPSAAAGAPVAPPAPVAPAAPALPSAPVPPAPTAAPVVPALPTAQVPPAAPVPPTAALPPVAPVPSLVPAAPVLPVAPSTGGRSSAARGAPGGAKVPTVRTPAVGGPAGSSSARSAASPATAAAERGTVVVIPDRGRFHRAQCRYVRDAGGAVELSRASATKQGYAACGVCKP